MPTPPATDPSASRPRRRDSGARGRPVTAGQATRSAMLQAFRTPVRGYAFASRPPDAPEPVPGQLARLVREPANPADPLAVAVWVEGDGPGWRIGYLDRGVSARVAPRLDRGLRIDARVDGWVPEPDGRWRRPVLVLLPRDRAPSPAAPAGRSGSAERGASAEPAPTPPASTPPVRTPSAPAPPRPRRTDGSDPTAREAQPEGRSARPSPSSPLPAPAAPEASGRNAGQIWGRPPGVARRRLPTRTVPRQGRRPAG